MDKMQNIKKQYLIWMFNHIEGEDIGLEEYESIRWFEQRGYTYDEARQEVLNKYRAKLLNDNKITQTIVGYEDVELLFSDFSNNNSDDILDNKKLYERYINSISSTFSVICDFSIENNELIDPHGVVKQIREVYIANEIVQGLVSQREYINSQQQRYKSITDKAETKTDILANHIIKYGFMDLPKVKDLPESNIPKLIGLIAINSIPYAIAMFDFLGFINHLLNNHFKTKDNLNKEISKWLGVSQREIKGNIAVLNPKSTDDRTRYNSCEYLDKVKVDFAKLK